MKSIRGAVALVTTVLGSVLGTGVAMAQEYPPSPAATEIVNPAATEIVNPAAQPAAVEELAATGGNVLLLAGLVAALLAAGVVALMVARRRRVAPR